MEPILIIPVVIIVALVIRVIAGSFDADRVHMYVKSRGWKLIDQSWDPFGPGWFGEQDARIYAIIYEDQDGNRHKAHVKTSVFSGVYLTNDCIVERAMPQANLEEENEALRARIAELESGEQSS